MKQTIRAFSLGLLSATILLSITYYLDKEQQSVVKTEPTTEQMVSALEEQGYYVSEDTPKVERSEQPEQKNEASPKSNPEEDSAIQEDETVVYNLSIKTGMTDRTVAESLSKTGIIDNKQAFLTFLRENNYATRIQIGDFVLNNKMTYEEVAKIITKSGS
jgi:hypothetical protein